MIRKKMTTLLVAASLFATLTVTSAFAQDMGGQTDTTGQVSQGTENQTNYSWVGLLGLVGLAGLMKKTAEDPNRDRMQTSQRPA